MSRVFISALLISLFVACGNKNTNPTPNPSTNTWNSAKWNTAKWEK